MEIHAQCRRIWARLGFDRADAPPSWKDFRDPDAAWLVATNADETSCELWGSRRSQGSIFTLHRANAKSIVGAALEVEFSDQGDPLKITKYEPGLRLVQGFASSRDRRASWVQLGWGSYADANLVWRPRHSLSFSGPRGAENTTRFVSVLRGHRKLLPWEAIADLQVERDKGHLLLWETDGLLRAALGLAGQDTLAIPLPRRPRAGADPVEALRLGEKMCLRGVTAEGRFTPPFRLGWAMAATLSAKALGAAAVLLLGGWTLARCAAGPEAIDRNFVA